MDYLNWLQEHDVQVVIGIAVIGVFVVIYLLLKGLEE